MHVHIGLDSNCVGDTDMPPSKFLIVDGDADVGRVWQALDGKLRGSAPARWGRRNCFDLEHAPVHVVLRATDAKVGVVDVTYGRLVVHLEVGLVEHPPPRSRTTALAQHQYRVDLTTRPL